jgi:mono/diheme cytochrome c family protein
MRRIYLFLGLLVLFGLAGLAYLFTPVRGPERDLSLEADAARGAYLIRVGSCVACHTDIKNEGAFLAGGAAIETPFGSFYPPNITSDKEAGIGAWTLQEFANAMSNGVGRNGEHLYPAFPYDNYTKLSDQDIVDLYAGLMATEPVAEPAVDHDLGFPFNIRLSMQGWKRLFFTPERFEADPSRSERWNRGAYLANGPAHCGACHTPRNPFGAALKDQHFKGTPAGSRPFFPPIDTASLKERGYDEATLKDALTGGFDPDFDTLGGKMGEAINESLVHYSDADMDALVAYLLDQD